ncbi:hypothetical protein [Propionivibrio limicola]|uniref:hypothetical protein n=1 Tax=Propionivibrio limicola TaxID=167645 RepID=UPI0012915290|nr:hypothetical protein [Propionivibrio limicola]
MTGNNSVMAVIAANDAAAPSGMDISPVQNSAQENTQTMTDAVMEVQAKGGFSAKPTMGELIEFQVTGLLVVFVVLGGITLVCNLMARILKAVVPDLYHVKSKKAL